MDPFRRVVDGFLKFLSRGPVAASGKIFTGKPPKKSNGVLRGIKKVLCTKHDGRPLEAFAIKCRHVVHVLWLVAG